MAEAVCGESSAMSELEVNPESSTPTSPAASTSGPEFAVVHQPSYAHTVFLGPEGLRPGWGFAFYVLMFYPLQKLAVDLAWTRDLGSSGLWSMMLEELFNLVAAVVPAVVLVRVEQSVEAVRVAGKASLRTVVLVGFVVGIYGDQPADIRSLRTARLRIRSGRAAWGALREVRRVLGRDVPAGGTVRGVSAAGLHPIHAGARDWLLALGDGPVVCVRIDPPAK